MCFFPHVLVLKLKYVANDFFFFLKEFVITDDLCIFVREVFTICMTSISILYLNSFLRF